MKSSATFNPVLSAMFNQFFVNPAGFVGLRLAPIFTTGEISASYPVFGKANLVNVPTLKVRAPGTPFQRSTGSISDDQYSCRNYGHETPVADEIRKKYAMQIDADRAGMRRNAHTILVNHEQRVASLFGGGGITNSTPSVKWDVYATSDPLADVKAAKAVIWAQTGLEPNTLTLPKLVADKLALHPKIRAIYPTFNGPITQEMLRAAFEIDKLHIASGVVNTANEGQAISIGAIWGNNVFLSVSNEGQDLELPNAARTFLWNAAGEGGGGEAGSFVETYRDDTIKSDVHRSLHHTDEKLCGADFVYRLNNVLT
jgi:hypothetical protein